MIPEIHQQGGISSPGEPSPIMGRRPECNGLGETVIDSTSRGWSIDLRELWARRELLYFLIWRDIKVRYRDTLLGGAWALAQPTLMMVIFTVFLAPAVAGEGPAGFLPYPLYVYSGFLAWNYFASAITGASMSVVQSEGLITKVYFPRLILPLATVGANLIDLAIASAGMVFLMLYYHIAPGWSVLLLPVWVSLCALAGFGVGTLLAALNVRYKDFRFLVPYMMQVWMFSTPAIFIQRAETPPAIMFGSADIHEKIRLLLLQMNPVVSLIISFRAVALGGPSPWQPLAVSSVVIIAFLAAGCYYFRRVEDTFADVI